MFEQTCAYMPPCFFDACDAMFSQQVRACVACVVCACACAHVRVRVRVRLCVCVCARVCMRVRCVCACVCSARNKQAWVAASLLLYAGSPPRFERCVFASCMCTRVACRRRPSQEAMVQDYLADVSFWDMCIYVALCWTGLGVL
jgi:hypothetical protein